MPNHSNATKLTPSASAEEPPFLEVGTDVSAKFKGAFCEAKIIDISKNVKLRVTYEGLSGSYLIDDADVKEGSTLEVGNRIEAKHPKKKQQTYAQATISKVLDQSRYTVVFDDGDHCILRRNSICLKSGKHFAESDTLDQLPLTNPEHFGNPVKVATSEHRTPHRSVQNPVRYNDSSSNDSDSNPRHNSSLSSSRSRNAAKKETATVGQLEPTTSSSTPSAGRSRRVVSARKRRDSSSSKHLDDLGDTSMESIQDSSDVGTANTNVKFGLIATGVKLMVRYGKGKVQNVYEAKVNKIETNSSGRTRYFVHYTGWNTRYDEWVTQNRVVSIVTEKEIGREGKSRKTDTKPTVSHAKAATSSDNLKTIDEAPKDKPSEGRQPKKEAERAERREKEKEKELEKKRKSKLDNEVGEKRRRRESEKEPETSTEREVASRDDKKPLKGKEKIVEKAGDVTVRTRRFRQSEIASITDPEGCHASPVRCPESEEAERKLEAPGFQEMQQPRSVGEVKTSLVSKSTTTLADTSVATSVATMASALTSSSFLLNHAEPAQIKTPTDSDDCSGTDDQDKGTDTDKAETDEYIPRRPFKSYMKTMNFCGEITEQDCDKKISILQERIIELRQFYMFLKSGLADLDRKRKRPRTEVSG